MADIVFDLADLHRQATHERSHYYVAKTAERAIREISRMRELLDQIKTVCDDNAGPTCNQAMALAFVRQVAAHATTT